jgi:hypothetical protein
MDAGFCRSCGAFKDEAAAATKATQASQDCYGCTTAIPTIQAETSPSQGHVA